MLVVTERDMKKRIGGKKIRRAFIRMLRNHELDKFEKSGYITRVEFRKDMPVIKDYKTKIFPYWNLLNTVNEYVKFPRRSTYEQQYIEYVELKELMETDHFVKEFTHTYDRSTGFVSSHNDKYVVTATVMWFNNNMTKKLRRGIIDEHKDINNYNVLVRNYLPPYKYDNVEYYYYNDVGVVMDGVFTSDDIDKKPLDITKYPPETNFDIFSIICAKRK